MTAAVSLGRLSTRCAATPAIRDSFSSRSHVLSRSLPSSFTSSLTHPPSVLSHTPTRLLATATASPASSHPDLPQPPLNTQHLTPSQLRAASAARAQKAVADAKAFEERRERTLRYKNIALGLACIGFVVWCYWFSVYSVRKSADSLTGGDVEEIERELDEEERLKAAERK